MKTSMLTATAALLVVWASAAEAAASCRPLVDSH